MTSTPDSPPTPRTTSRVQRSRWPGWIWAIPIAAAGIVSWLLVREFTRRGTDVVVTFTEAAQMKAQDTRVHYRGLEIGRVTSVELSKNRQDIVVHLDIDDSVEPDLTTGTRFYLVGAEPSLSDLSSLKSLFAGPSIEMVPGAGKPVRQFAGITGSPPPVLSASVPYHVLFEGNVGQLKRGAPVTLRGFTVGEVVGVNLSIDPERGTITTPVDLLLDPTRFHTHERADNGATLFKATMKRLVANGLRASLTQNPPLIGAPQVELVMSSEADATPPASQSEDESQIPVQQSSLQTLPAKIAQLPLAEIGNNIRAITEHVKTLVSAPQLKDSVNHLDRSLTELDKVMQSAGPEVQPTLQSVHQTVNQLRQTATEIDGTAAAARKLMGGSAASPNGNLQQAMYELTGAARAIRVLANYLDQHPEALVKGRSSESTEIAR
jgi:paraquat-inducible protein B